MPFLLPVLAAVGGGSALAGGVALGSAAIGAGTAIYSANQQNKAAKQGLQAQEQADRDKLAAQQPALDRIPQLQTPYVHGGYNALAQLANEYGLGAPAASAGPRRIPAPRLTTA